MQDAPFRPHSLKQDEALFSDEDMTLVATGTQWGKTQLGAWWMKRQIHKCADERANFVIAAPTYKILNQSTMPYFLEIMRGDADYSKSDACMKVHGGGTVFFRTETDPDSIVGIPNTRAGWLDEAGKMRLYFWENFQARIAAKGARTLLTTSPYTLNWVYKQLVRPFEKGESMGGIKVIQAASWENPYHTLYDPEKRRIMRAKMDPRRFDMIFGGQWRRMAGSVYDCWDDEENYCKPCTLPEGTRYIAGIDWGYTDPFVLVIRAITPEGKHYGVSEFYKTGMTLPEMIEVAKQKRKVWNISKFWADPSQPGAIEEFNRNGLPCEGADNDIRRGIDLHYELIKTRKYKEFEGSMPHAADERESYHYPEPEDLGPDDDSKELLPVAQADHVMDAIRYVTMMTYRTDMRRTPVVPGTVKKQEPVHERIERLKRGNRNNRAETWS
jgi:hypothetical protein